METGEKYLSVSILGQINVGAFPNKAKKQPKDPDYIGNGIAIWIRKKGDKELIQTKKIPLQIVEDI